MEELTEVNILTTKYLQRIRNKLVLPTEHGKFQELETPGAME